MAKRKILETTGDVKSEIPDNGKAEAKLPANLPNVDSPSISPAVTDPVAIDEAAIDPKPEPEIAATKSESKSETINFALVPVAPIAQGVDATAEMPKVAPLFTLKTRYKVYGRMAASVAIGAVLGAIGGTLITGALAPRSSQSVAAVEENKSMQQSLSRLARDVTALKTHVAENDKINSELVATGKAKSPEKIRQEMAEITGSIAAPMTMAALETNSAVASATPVAAPSSTASLAQASAPESVPVPRPAPRLAMVDTQAARPTVVRDWSIRDAQGGYIYVENHGEIYQIVPGAPLPGLGPVQSIKRLDGRWVVTTPKGIIVSMRDRRYFE
jgi:hypothetical protein